MHFNLLRFTGLPSNKKNQQLLVIVFGLIVLLTISVWEIKTSRQIVNEKNALNIKLQADLIKLNEMNISPKKNIVTTQQPKKLQPQVAREIFQPKISTLILQINYANIRDLAEIIRDKNNSLLSQYGSVIPDPRTNVILVQDIDKQLQKISELIKTLDKPKKQVLIEARIVTMTRDSADELGVRFGFIQNKQTSDSISPANKVGFDLSAVPIAANPATIGLAIATLGKNALLDLELSALQSEGRAEIIASPKLIATNQEPAVIQSGEDIPYQRLTVSGSTSVSFKKAVLSLKVVPNITYDGKLIMSISINQDTDSGRRVQGVPIISTKYLETKVMIADNQTIVLGGIYKEDQNNSIIRVPILGSLPLLGGLFRHTELKHSNEELLIFLTPKIIAIK